MSGNIVVIDHSMMSTFRSCHEKCRLRYRYEETSPGHFVGLVPKQPRSAPTFGQAIHAAIRVWDETEDIGKAELALVAAARSLPISMEENPTEPRTIERGIALLHAYLERWKDQPFKLVRQADGRPYVEVRFSVHIGEIDGSPIIYAGIIDRIVEHDGRRYILDLKTTRQSLSAFEKSVKPNHQLTGYCLGAEAITGQKVFATGYDCIFVSTRKPDLKKGGWWQFGVDIEKDFMRPFSQRTSTDVDEFIETALATAGEYISHTKQPGRWCTNAPTACGMYGGCDYQRVCLNNCDKTVIENFYNKEEWKVMQLTTNEAGGQQ